MNVDMRLCREVALAMAPKDVQSRPCEEVVLWVEVDILRSNASVRYCAVEGNRRIGWLRFINTHTQFEVH